MSSILLASIFSLQPRLFLATDDQAGGGGGAAGASTVEADFLAHLPGGEMLAGATGGKPPEDPDALPATWTEENAQHEEGEDGDGGDAAAIEAKRVADEAAAAEAAKRDEVPPPALDELLKTLPEAAQAQFGEVLKERETLKAEKETLAKEVETLKAAAPAPRLASTAAHPLASVESEEGLNFHAELARELKSFARRNLVNGGEMPRELFARATGRKADEVKDEELQFTPEQAADMLDRAERMESDVIPSRREYLTIEKQSRDWVQQHYADMLKPESEPGKLYSAFLQQFPQVKLLPRWPSALAAMVKGHLVMEAEHKEREAKAAGKSAAKEPVAPPVPGRTGAAAANGAAKPSSPKPKRTVELSASMGAEELAGIL